MYCLLFTFFYQRGNDDQTGKFATIIAEMQIADKVRGFATNVANYQPVGSLICPQPGTCKGQMSNDPCCADDPCNLQKDWNWAHNELNYVDVLDYKLRAAIPGFTPAFIIDTGRNGKPNSRTDCGNWCNPRGTGVGHVPTTVTPDGRIDALFWLKTPGESDGCTEILPDGTSCPRFDQMCASVDSLGSQSGEPRAPEAGIWFHYQIAMLAENANMGDASVFSTPGSCGTISSGSQLTILTDASEAHHAGHLNWNASSQHGSNQGVTMLALRARHSRMLFKADSADDFQGKDGGVNRACRGASATDNNPSNYEIHAAATLDECKTICMSVAGCKGIEFSRGRCEVWTRMGGIEATIELSGFSCYTYGETAATGEFYPVDGGVDRACRGGSTTDNSPSNYEVHSATTLDNCKAICMSVTGCKGIEFSPGRCEVWTRTGGIQASRELAGFSCFAYSNVSNVEKCSELSSAQISAALSVSHIPLSVPRNSHCSEYGTALSCRHLHYAASTSDMQAVLYNDDAGKPQLLLLGPANSVVTGPRALASSLGPELIQGQLRDSRGHKQTKESGGRPLQFFRGFATFWMSLSGQIASSIPCLPWPTDRNRKRLLPWVGLKGKQKHRRLLGLILGVYCFQGTLSGGNRKGRHHVYGEPILRRPLLNGSPRRDQLRFKQIFGASRLRNMFGPREDPGGACCRLEIWFQRGGSFLAIWNPHLFPFQYAPLSGQRPSRIGHVRPLATLQ